MSSEGKDDIPIGIRRLIPRLGTGLEVLMRRADKISIP